MRMLRKMTKLFFYYKILLFTFYKIESIVRKRTVRSVEDKTYFGNLGLSAPPRHHRQNQRMGSGWATHSVNRN